MLQIQTYPFYSYLAALTTLTLMIFGFALSVFYHLRRKRIQMKAKTFQDECNQETHNKRIAADLHDDLGSLLTGLKLSLRELSLKQPGDILLETSEALLEQSMARMREVSFNLVPRELESGGLDAAVETLVERLNVTALFRVNYTSSFDGSNYEVEKSMLIYRVIQEMTTNAIKHSGASIIEIGIATKLNRLIVEVRDDGKGFDYAPALNKKKSSGLKNIQSRLELINAVLMIESATGNGTHYFISIPLRQLNHGTNQQN